MSSCLLEIYAQSYKDEQNLEIRCLCINSNTKLLEKETEKRWDLSLLLLSLDFNQLWLRVFYRARNWSQNTAHIIVFQPHPHLIEHQSVQNSPHGPNTDKNSNSIWLQQMTDDPTFELFLSDPSPIIGNACHSLTNSLTNSLPFSKLDWCDPGVWRCQLKTCWGLLLLLMLMMRIVLATVCCRFGNWG